MYEFRPIRVSGIGVNISKNTKTYKDKEFYNFKT